MTVKMKLSPFRTAMLSAVAFSAFTGLSQSAHAQTEEAEAESSRTLDTVTVTARNRAESLQDVPMSITALDEEAMAAKNIASLDDLAKFTSGFSFESFSGGFAMPTIRGQSQTRVTALEVNVSTFFDEVYMPRSWAIDIGTSTLSRIEVVKGPQSARYGRNAFAGAINYIPFKASGGLDGPTGSVVGTVGSDERLDYGFNGAIPLGDRFAVGATYMSSEYDGSWGNSHPYAGVDIGPGTSGNSGGWDNSSYSLTAFAEPVDGWTIEAGFYNFDVSREIGANQQFSEANGDFNCGSVRNFGTNSLFCGEVPGPVEDIAIDPRAYGVQSDTDITRIQTSYDLTDEIELSYLFGRVKGEVDIANMTVPDAVNCGPVCEFQNAPIGAIDYDSHEFGLDYEGDSWRGGIGAFISEGQDDYEFEYVIANGISSDNFPSLPDDTTAQRFPLTNSTTLTDIESIFAELQYSLPNDKTRVGVEARYSETKITSINNVSGNVIGEKFIAVTPRFTLEHDLTEDALLYASVAKGAKAGGFNPTAVAEEYRVFDEEVNWTTEVGAKTTWLGGNLIVNGAVFYTDWSDMQVTSPDPSSSDPQAVTITLNLGNATVYGGELDFNYLATDNLSFDGTFSYSKGEFSDGTTDASFTRTPGSCDGMACPLSGDISGNAISRTPGEQASLGVKWEDQLSIWNDPTWSIRGDLSWQSEQYVTSMNLATIPSRTLLGANASMVWDNFDVSLWVKNLTDESYVSNSYVVILPFGNTYQTFYGPRRSFGMTAKYHF